jgi:beta-lactamase class A
VLAAKVVERLSGRSGKFGVAIKDLASGRGVLIDADGEYEAASLFKLWVMYEVYKQREAGNVSFAEHLVLTERHVAYDLGTLDRPAGASIPLVEALERMITISDNSSAILLTDRVGAFNINRDLRELGMLHTRLILDDLVTSPADVLGFLEMLAQGEAVSPQASAEMIHLMARQRINDRIPKLLPEGVVVAHKTGNLPGVVNDVGVVYGPEAAFIIAVLTSNTTNEAEAARATGDLAATAYEHFRGSSAPLAPSFPTLAPSPTKGLSSPTPAPTDTAVPSVAVPANPPGTQGIPEPGTPVELRPGSIAPGDGPVRALTPASLQSIPAEPSRSLVPQSARPAPTSVQDSATPRPRTPSSAL